MSRRSEVETMPITKVMAESVELAITADLKYQELTQCGRKFGITGEVGEILACQKLRLRLVKHPRSEGYDALDADNQRVQIKTRRSETEDEPNIGGRLGTFSKHPYDYALMVTLSRDCRLLGIWKATKQKLQPIIDKHKRSNPTLRQFRDAGEAVFLKK